MNWIKLNERQPVKEGKYIVKTIFTNTSVPYPQYNYVYTRWIPNENPKKSRFDLSNQRALKWLEED